MQTVVLSEDVAAAFPVGIHTNYQILRSHEEEIRTGLFGWRKEVVKVIDHLRLTGITVHTVSGETWEIPLGSNTPESLPTSLGTEVSTASNSEE